MTNFNREEYNVAIGKWEECCGNFAEMENMVPPNYVFELSLEQIEWLRTKNLYHNFCAEMGIYEEQLVLVLCPLNEEGGKIELDEYTYSVLSELNNDLRLVETQQYAVVKNAVLSKDLRKVDNDCDIFLPVANMPLMEQDKAVDAIEAWRNESSNWFYLECNEFGGSRVFRKFYVPSQNLYPPKEGLSRFVCSFGLKFSDVYQRMLVTLIFISFYDNLHGNISSSTEIISNTYDWSQPCPPICRV